MIETKQQAARTENQNLTWSVGHLVAVSPSHPVTLVIGYGNDLRGDDAVGTRVAAAVAGWHAAGVRVLAVRQLTPELAEILAAARLAIFVDAYPVAASVPGDADELGVAVHPIGPEPSASPLGHTSDPGRLLALTQALYGAHPPAWLVRVPAATFGMGEALSITAARGVGAALRHIRRLLAPSAP